MKNFHSKPILLSKLNDANSQETNSTHKLERKKNIDLINCTQANENEFKTKTYSARPIRLAYHMHIGVRR